MKKMMTMLFVALMCQAAAAQKAASNMIEGYFKAKNTKVEVVDLKQENLKEIMAFSSADEVKLLKKMTRMSGIKVRRLDDDTRAKVLADIKRVEADGYSRTTDQQGNVTLTRAGKDGKLQEVIFYSIGERVCEIAFFVGTFNKADIDALRKLGN